MAILTTNLTYTVVIGGPLEITPLVLVDYCKGFSYPVTTFTASGGVLPYTWDASGSTLPTGMSFNTGTQQLSGTPTTSGSFNLHLSLTDASPTTVTGDFPFDIYVPPTITTTSLPDGIYNVSYNTTVSATPGSAAITTWTVVYGSLPGGLTLNSGTGVIDGTITSLFGYFSAAIRATDANGCYDERLLSINVTNTPLVIDTTTLPGSCRGAAYSQTLSASGGTVPYTWTIQSGSLPSSLSLNASTGDITGTVDVGASIHTYSFTIRVTDNDANTADRPLSIEIYGEPVWVTTSPMPGGNLTVGYSQFLNATDGVVYGLVGGSLPDGLGLDVGGLISGTPTVENTFTFTAEATSVNGCASDKVLSITIGEQPPTVTGTFNNVCNRINYYNASLAVTGGTGPYVYALDSGSFPDNVALNPVTGVISGYITTPGTYSFTIRVTDSLTLTSTTDFSFIVYNSPIINPLALPPAVIGKPFGYSLSASGGTQPFIWILSSSLPAGLNFDPYTASIFGVPTVSDNTFLIVITVRDAHGCSDTKTIPLQIYGPPVIGTLVLTPACQNHIYDQTIAVSGGLPPYYFFITSSNFPPQNLQLDPLTGRLYGIALIAGSYSFTIKVVDQNNLYTSRDYVLIVRPEAECGQIDEGPNVTVTKPRLASTESDPVFVQDPFHQKHLVEYLPVPFLLKDE